MVEIFRSNFFLLQWTRWNLTQTTNAAKQTKTKENEERRDRGIWKDRTKVLLDGWQYLILNNAKKKDRWKVVKKSNEDEKKRLPQRIDKKGSILFVMDMDWRWPNKKINHGGHIYCAHKHCAHIYCAHIHCAHIHCATIYCAHISLRAYTLPKYILRAYITAHIVRN